MKNLPPSKSIRRYCLWCCIGNSREIQLCTIYDCSLYPYRNGKKLDLQALASLNPKLTEEDLQKIVFLTPVKAIRERCRYCSVFSSKEIKNCVHTDCELYYFRMRKNPNRKGMGNPNLHLAKKVSSAGYNNDNGSGNDISQM